MSFRKDEIFILKNSHLSFQNYDFTGLHYIARFYPSVEIQMLFKTAF